MGEIFIAGYGDGNIYKWNGKDKPEIFANGFSAPAGLFWSKKGYVLVANRNVGEIVKIDEHGNKNIISKNHSLPVGIVEQDDGTIFVNCYSGDVDVIDTGDGVNSIKELGTPGAGIALSDKGRVYAVDYGKGEIVELNKKGIVRNVAKGLKTPVALSISPIGNLLAGCWGDGTIYNVEAE